MELIRYYLDEMFEAHGVRPSVAFDSKTLGWAQLVLRDRTPRQARAIVQRYVRSEDTKLQEAAWPFGYLPSRVAQIELELKGAQKKTAAKRELEETERRSREERDKRLQQVEQERAPPPADFREFTRALAAGKRLAEGE